MGNQMKYSSQLTRLILRDWFKRNWLATSLMTVFSAAAFVSFVNPIISGKQEIATVVRSQQIADKYNAATMITFIELSNGRNTSFVLPNGTIPPAPGSSIRVMHNQHLLLGDSFQWIQ
jgi:hypothetical protein